MQFIESSSEYQYLFLYVLEAWHIFDIWQVFQNYALDYLQMDKQLKIFKLKQKAWM